MELRPDQMKSTRDDGSAAVVIFLPLSGLLDTLAANANGKRTWTPFIHSHAHTLEPPVNLTCMRLDCGRKLENLEKTHMYPEPLLL